MEIGIFFANIKNAFSEIDDELLLLEKVRELGYSYIELDCDVLMEKSKAFFEKAKELSIGFSVYAFTDENCVMRNGIKAEDALGFLKEHNIKNLMMVCFPSDKTAFNDAIFSSLNHLCECTEKHGISVLVEDFDSKKIPCGNCGDMLFFGEKVSKLKYTFDTGNFAYFGEDALECFEKLKGRIGHVHLKDRNPDMSVTETGKGSIPIEEIVGKLKESGYNGTISVEMFGASDDPKKLMDAFLFVNRIINQKEI